MISIAKAKKLILENTSVLPVESKDFEATLGQALAQDVVAATDWPPFSRSTMDGFALKISDVQSFKSQKAVALNVVGESKAGQPFLGKIGKGQTVKISTGALLPQGADSVVMKEYVKITGDKVVVLGKAFKGDHVRWKGQDAKKNEILISQGTQITPGIVAILASFGQRKIRVFKTPRVGILTTGDELVGLKSKLKPGQIRSANEHALAAQVKQLGADPFVLGHAKDNLASVVEKIRPGLGFDILLVSGGVSVGDHDFVRQALRKLGAKEIFWKVAVKPGKPLVFAKRGSCHVFGLPGNTVASTVSFLTFVRPCILKMSGHKAYLLKTAEAILDHDICDQDSRAKILRGIVSAKKGRRCVRLSADQISENVMSMAQANCFWTVEQGVDFIPKGKSITFEYI